jgi:hypothetical protein
MSLLKNLSIVMTSFCLLLTSTISHAQLTDFQTGFYRLTTAWKGDGISLDVFNGGVNYQLQLAPTGNYSGQLWKITALGGGYYRLTTMWQGDGQSLDVVNDGVNNKLQLAPTGNYGGQQWKITDLGGGYYRLTTAWQGDGKSLDGVQLAPTGNYSGQLWKISAQALTCNQQAATLTSVVAKINNVTTNSVTTNFNQNPPWQLVSAQCYTASGQMAPGGRVTNAAGQQNWICGAATLVPTSINVVAIYCQ